MSTQTRQHAGAPVADQFAATQRTETGTLTPETAHLAFAPTPRRTAPGIRTFPAPPDRPDMIRGIPTHLKAAS